MKGIILDIKKFFSSIKTYKKEYQHSFWNLKQIFYVLISTLKKTWVLICLGMIVLVMTIILSINHIFNEKLYFSIILFFLFMVYVAINIIVIVFQNINIVYRNHLKIDYNIIKRINRLSTFFVSIVIVVFLGITQIWFVKNYVNPPLFTTSITNKEGEVVPIIGYSYYDEYGNYLYDGALIQDVEAKRQDGRLSQLSFKATNNPLFDITVEVRYSKSRIDQIIIEKSYYNSYVYNSYVVSRDANGDIDNSYSIKCNYNLEKTTIMYEYNASSFVQTETNDYFIQKAGNNQLIISEFEKQEFSKEIVDGQSKIKLTENIKNKSLVDDIDSLIGLIKTNDLVLTKNDQIISSSSDTDKDIQSFMAELNDVYSTDYDMYAYVDANSSLIYYYNENIIDTVSQTNSGLLEINEMEINKDFSEQPIEHLDTKYDGNIKVYEYTNNYWWTNNQTKQIREYTYKPIYQNGNIDYIDQYENNHMVFRYVFEKQDYGYKVSHYSYVRNDLKQYVSYDGNNNLFLNTEFWSPATPMYIIRNKNLYINALLKQTIPYEYLLNN